MLTENSPPPDVVTSFIPVFIITIIAEYLYFRKKYPKRYSRYFETGDAVSSISAGIFTLILDINCKWMYAIPYIFLYNKLALFHWDFSSYWTVLIVTVLVDLGYYWAHRLSHMINFVWMSHVAHHSSEYMNFTTALRQGSVEGPIYSSVYLPLAVLGLPLPIFVLYKQCNAIFQFFIHTEAIRKLHPLIEYVFNTPSHHRVHHARNPKYLDKNFAGMFILWDRIFGTYADEIEEPVYGVVHPLDTTTPFWVQTHHWLYVLNVFWTTPGLYNKIKLVFFKQAGWKIGKDGKEYNDSIPFPEVNPKLARFTHNIPPVLTAYLAVQFLIIMIAASFFFEIQNKLPTVTVLGVSLYLLYSLQVIGMGFNKNPYAQVAELLRLIFTFVISVAISFPHNTGKLNAQLVVTFIYVVVSAGLCFNVRWLLPVKAPKQA